MQMGILSRVCATSPTANDAFVTERSSMYATLAALFGTRKRTEANFNIQERRV